MLLDGMHIPLTTPFYPDGRLYLRKLEHNADRYSRTPASGLALLTMNGEATLLSDEETRQVLTAAIGASSPEMVMTAHVSRDSVRHTIDLAETAAKLGYDVVQLRVPAHLEGMNAQSIRTYLLSVADRTPMPILLEDHEALSSELLSEVAANPAFLGLSLGHASPGKMVERLRVVKAATLQSSREVLVTTIFAAVTNRMRLPEPASGSGNYIAAGALSGGVTALATSPPLPAIKTRTKRVGFQILTTRTPTLIDCLKEGASGSLLPFAAGAPQAVYEVHAAWKDGNPALATEKQGRLLAAADEVEEHLGVAAIKAACDLNGYYGGKPRLPLLPLSGEQRIRVEALMAGMRN